jgi:hypothetical protein
MAGNVLGNVPSAGPPTGGARVRPIPPRICEHRRHCLRRADVDPYVTAVSPAQLLQPLCKRREASLPFRIVRGQTAQACRCAASARPAAPALRPATPPSSEMNSRRFTRSPRRRSRAAPAGSCRRRAADERDELAPFHCPMPPVLPTERIAHLNTAGDCCAAGFRSSLRRRWVFRDGRYQTMARVRSPPNPDHNSERLMLARAAPHLPPHASLPHTPGSFILSQSGERRQSSEMSSITFPACSQCQMV